MSDCPDGCGCGVTWYCGGFALPCETCAGSGDTTTDTPSATKGTHESWLTI